MLSPASGFRHGGQYGTAGHGIHCKPSHFEKQFWMANTVILTSYITFQRNHNEIFH
jgi:hypothetical protein